MSLFNFLFACVWLAVCISPSQSWVQISALNKCKINNGISFALKSTVDGAGEGFGQYKREKGGKSNRSTSKAKGFSKPWDKVEPIIPIITGDMPCACNSGKIYQECCELHHTNTFGVHVAATEEVPSAEIAVGSPEGILRARYTGRKLNLFHFFRRLPYYLSGFRFFVILQNCRTFVLQFFLSFLFHNYSVRCDPERIVTHELLPSKKYSTRSWLCRTFVLPSAVKDCPTAEADVLMKTSRGRR